MHPTCKFVSSACKPVSSACEPVCPACALVCPGAAALLAGRNDAALQLVSAQPRVTLTMTVPAPIMARPTMAMPTILQVRAEPGARQDLPTPQGARPPRRRAIAPLPGCTARAARLLLHRILHEAGLCHRLALGRRVAGALYALLPTMVVLTMITLTLTVASQGPFTLSFLAYVLYLGFELIMREAVRLQSCSGLLHLFPCLLHPVPCLLHPFTLLTTPLLAYYTPYFVTCHWACVSASCSATHPLLYFAALSHLVASPPQLRFRSCSVDRQTGADRLFQEVLDEATAADSSTHFKEYRCPAPRVPPAAKESVRWSVFRGMLFGSNELRSNLPAGKSPRRHNKLGLARSASEILAGVVGAVGGPGVSRRASTCEDLSGSLTDSPSKLTPSCSVTTGSVDLL